MKIRFLIFFTGKPITDQIHMLIGIRGSGKTAAMSSLCERIGKLDDWIIIKISPVDNVLDALYKNLLYNKKRFIKFSLPCFSEFIAFLSYDEF